MCSATGCGSSTLAALEDGKLPGLVNSSLVQHQVAIQGPSPPLLPMLSIDCGGVITRIGLDKDAVRAAGSSCAGLSCSDGSLNTYEFVFSVVALHGVLGLLFKFRGISSCVASSR